MDNAVLGKTMENMREHRDIKLVTTTKKVALEPNYHKTIFFSNKNY